MKITRIIIATKFRSMATAISIGAFMFVSGVSASQAEPTKAELFATVKHIGAIAKQQQADLDSAKAALATSTKSLSDAQTVEIPALKQAISDQATALAAAQAKITAVEAQRHKYVKLTLLFGGILLAEVLAVCGYFALKMGLFSI